MFISGRQLRVDNTRALSDLPRHVNYTNALSVLLEHVKPSNTCPGNPDDDFVEMIVKEGGQFLGTSDEVVATLDTSSVAKTVRASDCEILSESRCAKCRSYRTHLRVNLIIVKRVLQLHMMSMPSMQTYRGVAEMVSAHPSVC